MAYPVRIAARAERDLALIYEYIHAEDSDAAFEWYRGLNLQFFALETFPNRNPLTPEDPKLRHLLYGQKPDVYRIICRVGEKPKFVEILHIRHGAMKRFKPRGVQAEFLQGWLLKLCRWRSVLWLCPEFP